MDYKRGSEWRKWDLHVHPPFTKCNNGYPNEANVWDKFCEEIENSDVVAIGITDYFSLDNYFKFIEVFQTKYPRSTKRFFPNVELRLNESVNPKQQEVNLHLIFRSDITKEIGEEFLSKLLTEKTNNSGKKLSCKELADFDSATVTREGISKAIKDTFGPKAFQQDHVIILTAVNNDGIRPEAGVKRKEIITDEIDKLSDGFFGGSQNTIHFLDNNRLEGDEYINAKPVISGSDAHSFEELAAWSGKTVNGTSNDKETTWIKADTTFEGLVQILIEPKDRVSLQPSKPDEKEPYKVIDKIKFSGTDDFPSEIIFNSNLSTIIGSRSSGKSALINYIAHAVDKNGTEAKRPGPAAKKKWEEIGFNYTVEWSDGGVNDSGKVIFLPQNYLFNISSQPEIITEKIKPVLFRKFSSVKDLYSATNNTINSSNKAIEDAVKRWFGFISLSDRSEEEIKNFGDKKSVQLSRDGYQIKIDEIKSRLLLSDEDVENYQKVCKEKAEKENIIQETDTAINLLRSQYVNSQDNTIIDIEVDIEFNPSFENLPHKARQDVDKLTDESRIKLAKDVKEVVRKHINSLIEYKKTTREELKKILAANRELIEKNKQYEELSKLVEELNKQARILVSITNKEEELKQYKNKAAAEIETIKLNLVTRQKAFENFAKFSAELDQLENLITFGVEYELNPSTLTLLSERYNLREIKDHQLIVDGIINIGKVRAEVEEYLRSIKYSRIKIKTGENFIDLAVSTLSFSEEIRFTAVMEEDSIGGFKESSMTPGKQALFALTLLLDESTDAWPLLIDQPEDDLDSRSIYDQIVPYLKEKKKERQIIMVSHNANLVIGSDSEQIIVANKHGDDRKNKNDQMFDYHSGSIECTKTKIESACILESCGIREHACDILDGGEEAFEKRKNKYKI